MFYNVMLQTRTGIRLSTTLTTWACALLAKENYVPDHYYCLVFITTLVVCQKLNPLHYVYIKIYCAVSAYLHQDWIELSLIMKVMSHGFLFLFSIGLSLLSLHCICKLTANGTSKMSLLRNHNWTPLRNYEHLRQKVEQRRKATLHITGATI